MAPVRRSKRSTAEAIPRPLDDDPGAFQFQPNLDPSTFSPSQLRSSASEGTGASDDFYQQPQTPQSPHTDSLFDTAALSVTPSSAAPPGSIFSATPTAEQIAAQAPASARPVGRGSSFTFLEPLTSMTPIFPLRRQSHITLGGRRSSRSQAARRVVSHAAKKPDGHIPRPPNCFLLYRSWVRQQNKLYGKGDHQKKNEQNVSVIVGTLWEDLPEEKKEIFRAEARRLKEEHMQRYPGYKYAPRSRKDKNNANGGFPNSSDSGTRTQPKRITKKMAPEETASAVQEANEIIAREREQSARAAEAAAVSGDILLDTQTPAAGSSSTGSRTFQQPISFIPYRRSSSCPPVGETLASLSSAIRRSSPTPITRAPATNGRRQHTTSTGSNKSASSSRKGVINGGIDIPSVSFNAPSFNGSVARRTPLPMHGTSSPYPPPATRGRGAASTPLFDPNYALTRSYEPLASTSSSRPSSSGSGRRGGLHTDDLGQREALEEAVRSRPIQRASPAGLFDPGYSLATYSLSGNQNVDGNAGSPPAYAPSPAYQPLPPQVHGVGSPISIMPDRVPYAPQSPLEGAAPAFQALGLNSPIPTTLTVQYPDSAGANSREGWGQDHASGYTHGTSAATGFDMQYDGSGYVTHTHQAAYHQGGNGMVGGVPEVLPVLDYAHLGGGDSSMGGLMGDDGRAFQFTGSMQLAPLEIPATHKGLPPYQLSDPSHHFSPHLPQFHQHQQSPQHQPGNVTQQHVASLSPPSATANYSSSSSSSPAPQSSCNGNLPVDAQKANNLYTPAVLHTPSPPAQPQPSPRSPFLAIPQPISAIPPRLSASSDLYFDWNSASTSPAVATYPHPPQGQNEQHPHSNGTNLTSPTAGPTVGPYSSGSFDMGAYSSAGYPTHGAGNAGSAASYGASNSTSGLYGFNVGSGFGGSVSGSLGLGSRRLSRRASSLWMSRSSLAGDLAGVGLGEF